MKPDSSRSKFFEGKDHTAEVHHCLVSVKLDCGRDLRAVQNKFKIDHLTIENNMKSHRRFESELGEDDGIEYSKSLFNTAALYTACR